MNLLGCFYDTQRKGLHHYNLPFCSVLFTDTWFTTVFDAFKCCKLATFELTILYNPKRKSLLEFISDLCQLVRLFRKFQETQRAETWPPSVSLSKQMFTSVGIRLRLFLWHTGIELPPYHFLNECLWLRDIHNVSFLKPWEVSHPFSVPYFVDVCFSRCLRMRFLWLYLIPL